jgi:DNA-binding MarR family transcriptional regulator
MPRSKIGDEIRQTRPFRSPQEEVIIALLRTVDVVKGRKTATFEAAGLTQQQYNVLRILRGAGAEGLPTLEIGARMIERTPGITRLIDRMLKKDLVCRERSSEDRRVVYARLTPAGLELVNELDESVDLMNRQALGKLRRKDCAPLLELLDRVRAG